LLWLIKLLKKAKIFFCVEESKTAAPETEGKVKFGKLIYYLFLLFTSFIQPVVFATVHTKMFFFTWNMMFCATVLDLRKWLIKWK